MSKQDSMTAPENWAEWFEMCAITRCGDETRAALGKFAHERYKSKLRGYLEKRGLSKDWLPEANDLLGSSQPGACWHDLEASYWHSPRASDSASDDTQGTEGAKTYKKYYQAVAAGITDNSDAASARNFLEGATTSFLIRTRCRQLISDALRQRMNPWEGQPPQMEPPDGDDGEAERIAQELFKRLDTGQKILVIATINKVSPGHPEIEQRLQLQHAALFERRKKALAVLRSIMVAYDLDHPGCLLVFSFLSKKLQDWAITPECGINDCLFPEKG